MISTPGKIKLGYLSYGQSKSKVKQQDSSIQKSKSVFGNENNDLFAGMDKRNLSYLESQIMQKQKEKRKAQKKLESQQKQQKIKEMNDFDKQNIVQNPTITEIDASQQETQRSQEQNIFIISQKQEKAELKPNNKQLKIKVIIDNKEGNTQAQPYYEYLDGYIKSLQQLPSPQQKSHFVSYQRQGSPFVQRNQSLKNSFKQSIQTPNSQFGKKHQQNNEQYQVLLSKYRRQNYDSFSLSEKFEQSKQLQQQQIKQIIRLKQEIQLCSRSIQRYKKQKCKVIKKNNEIREAILVNRHNVCSINSNKYRSRDQSICYQQMEQYDTFKRFINKKR